MKLPRADHSDHSPHRQAVEQVRPQEVPHEEFGLALSGRCHGGDKLRGRRAESHQCEADESTRQFEFVGDGLCTVDQQAGRTDNDHQSDHRAKHIEPNAGTVRLGQLFHEVDMRLGLANARDDDPQGQSEHHEQNHALRAGDSVLDQKCKQHHGKDRERCLPGQSAPRGWYRRHQRCRRQHQRNVGNVAADHIAHANVEIAIARSDSRHHHLRCAGAEPDYHRPNHHRRHAQYHRDPSRAFHKLVGGKRENSQPSNGGYESGEHTCGSSGGPLSLVPAVRRVLLERSELRGLSSRSTGPRFPVAQADP